MSTYYIKHVKAKDFRGLDVIDADVPQGLVLITSNGKNGQGKTSMGLLFDFLVNGTEGFKAGKRMNAKEVAQLIVREGSDMAHAEAVLSTPSGDWLVKRDIARSGDNSVRIEVEGLPPSTKGATLTNLLA